MHAHTHIPTYRHTYIQPPSRQSSAGTKAAKENEEEDGYDMMGLGGLFAEEEEGLPDGGRDLTRGMYVCTYRPPDYVRGIRDD